MQRGREKEVRQKGEREREKWVLPNEVFSSRNLNRGFMVYVNPPPSPESCRNDAGSRWVGHAKCFCFFSFSSSSFIAKLCQGHRRNDDDYERHSRFPLLLPLLHSFSLSLDHWYGLLVSSTHGTWFYLTSTARTGRTCMY